MRTRNPGEVPGFVLLVLTAVLSCVSTPVQTVPAPEQSPPSMTIDHTVPVSIEFGADGASVFSIREDGVVDRWSLETGDVLASFCSPALRMRAAAVSPDGKTVATGDDDGVLRLWEANELHPTRIIQAHRSALSRIVWSPDSRRIATFGFQRDMALWNASTGKSIARFHSLDETGTRACAAFSADGTRLAFSVGEAFVRVCSADSGEALLTLAGSRGAVTSLCLSPSGRFLAATISGGNTGWERGRVWNIEDGETLTLLESKSLGSDEWSEPIVLARFSDDESELTTLDTSGLVEIWCGERFEPYSSFQAPGGVWPLMWQRDYPPAMDLLVPAPDESSVRVWRTRHVSEIGSLSCEGRVAVKFHPSRSLILAVDEHAVRVFDARTLELRLIRIEYEEANWLCVTSDRRFSGTPSAEGWARVMETVDGATTAARLDPWLRDPFAVRKALLVE